MKFGIAGPIAKDHIVLPTGERLEKYGAVAYTASALAKLLEGSQDEVICLSHVAPADFPAVSSLLDHPNIQPGRSNGPAKRYGRNRTDLCQRT